MTAFKQTFLRMNLDVDSRYLKPGEYRRLINGINVSPFGLNGLDAVISNIVGNAQVDNPNLQDVSTVIGFLEDPANNRCFFFVLHSGNNHTIYQYTGGSSIVIVMRTSLFAFNNNAGMIFSATIVGDLLIFSDNISEIKMINVVKAIAGGTYTPTLEEIVLIKRPPQLPLTGSALNDGSVSSNYIFKHYFQFYYRYIYSENEESVFSALSKVIRVSTLNPTYNAIDVTISALEVIPNTVKQIDYAVRVDGSNEYVIYRSDFPVGGSLPSRTHRFYNTELIETVSDSKSLKWNDSVPRTSAAIKFFENRLFCLNNKEGYDYPSTDITGATLTAASGSGDGRGSKGRGIYPVGLMFFDNYGRHAGVHKIGEITIPERVYSTTTNRYNIQWDLSGVANSTIPTWATHYAVVIGECKNIAYFLQAKAADVFFYIEKNDGTTAFSQTDDSSGQYIAIDLTNLSQQKIGYTFNEGDRMILYGKNSLSNPVKTDTRIVKQVGRFAIVERGEYTYAEFSNNNHDNSYTPIFEIYRNKESVGDVYSEIGAKYRISNAGTGSRAFSTTVSSYDGDIEKKSVNSYSYDGTGHSQTDPFVNKLELVAAEGFESMNLYEESFDKWVKGTGRSISKLSTGSKELLKTTAIRFGQEYFLNSTLNQVATFEALDEQALPSEGGPGYALAESGRVLVALQAAQTTGIYVGQGFVKTNNGNNFLTKTDNVIGDVNKNLGDHGCQDPYTVVSKEGRVYYLDRRRGYVVRRAQDGLTRISEYGMKSFFGNICRAYREIYMGPGGLGRIRAGWDPKYDCYVISFYHPSLVAGSLATVYFHENTNSWVCFANNFPEFFGVMGTLRLDFFSGQLWSQTNNTNFNNFGGSQVSRLLEIEPAPEGSLEKIWTGIDIDMDNIYTPSVPATKILLLAPTSWSDESTVSPPPTLGGTTISTTDYLDGLIKAYMPFVIHPAAMFKMIYKATISNLRRLVMMVSDPTPSDWIESGSGLPWTPVGSSIEIEFLGDGSSRFREILVNIPVGTYDLNIIASIVSPGVIVTGGNLSFRFMNGGIQIATKQYSGTFSQGINTDESIYFGQPITRILIWADVTFGVVDSIVYRVDSIQLKSRVPVTTETRIANISTILASGSTPIDTKTLEVTHPGVGSIDYQVVHDISNISAFNSNRLYVQVENMTPDIVFDLVLTFTVGLELADQLPSDEDIVYMYKKLDDGTILTRLKYPHFINRGSAWRAAFREYEADQNYGTSNESREKSRHKVRGQSVLLRILNNNTDISTMKSIEVRYNKSMLSNP